MLLSLYERTITLVETIPTFLYDVLVTLRTKNKFLRHFSLRYVELGTPSSVLKVVAKINSKNILYLFFPFLNDCRCADENNCDRRIVIRIIGIELLKIFEEIDRQTEPASFGGAGAAPGFHNYTG